LIEHVWSASGLEGVVPANHRVGASESEAVVERHDIVVTGGVDHVARCELVDECRDEACPDPVPTMGRKDLEQRNVGAQDPIADRGGEADHLVTVEGDRDCEACVKEFQMAIRGRLGGPAFPEAALELGCGDAIQPR